MANGFSLAAVAGRRELMEVGAINVHGAERTFLLSSTHGSEMSSFGAFLETVNFYENNNVCQYLWDYGAKLKKVFQEQITANGLTEYFKIEGPSVALSYTCLDKNHNISADFRTLFSQEMIKSGVLMPWISPSFAHKEDELTKTKRAISSALNIYAKALSEDINRFISPGQSVKPVFRKYN